MFKKPPKTGPHAECSTCPEHAFCPYGPDPKYPIDYKNIKSIIQFPQMP